jgi:acetyl-CoA C-acetyltransferase
MGVAVLGVGLSGFAPTSTGVSYREMIAHAAKRAYADAGITVDQIDGAVSVEEDLVSGYSIADEYTPDQLGVVRKPVYTIPGDFLHGIGSAVMQIRTGQFNVVVVEGYSKASNILSKDELLRFAFDPVFHRFGVSPHYLAGIEMRTFLTESDYEIEDVAEVVVKNRARALANPVAPYGDRFAIADVLDARMVAYPVTELMFPRHADGAVVVVLGTDAIARECARKPVYISGTGWGSGNSILERRDHGRSVGTEIAAAAAYQEAGIGDPTADVDAFFVSDLYAHRELMHLEALNAYDAPPEIVNPDGGCLGTGDLFEANGGARFVAAVQQLRGEAGASQLPVKRALVQGWRGLPTDSCAVAILDAERRAK